MTGTIPPAPFRRVQPPAWRHCRVAAFDRHREWLVGSRFLPDHHGEPGGRLRAFGMS
jgi:hypothetical protein